MMIRSAGIATTLFVVPIPIRLASFDYSSGKFSLDQISSQLEHCRWPTDEMGHDNCPFKENA